MLFKRTGKPLGRNSLVYNHLIEKPAFVEKQKLVFAEISNYKNITGQIWNLMVKFVW